MAQALHQGYPARLRAEGMELLIGLVLFVFWSVLTVGIVRLVDRARADARC